MLELIKCKYTICTQVQSYREIRMSIGLNTALIVYTYKCILQIIRYYIQLNSCFSLVFISFNDRCYIVKCAILRLMETVQC